MRWMSSVAALIAGIGLAAATLLAQALPNPYRMVDGWAQLLVQGGGERFRFAQRVEDAVIFSKGQEGIP